MRKRGEYDFKPTQRPDYEFISKRPQYYVWTKIDMIILVSILLLIISVIVLGVII